MNKIKWLFLAIILGNGWGYAGPLHDAVENGDLNQVKQLLDGGAKIDEPGDTGTALMLAAYWGHKEILIELLNRGANIESQNPELGSSLLLAAQNGYLEIVEELLSRGANINASRSSDGQTVIAAAHAESHKQTIETIKRWSIEKRIKVLDPGGIKILDEGNPGSYNRDFAAYGSKEQRKVAIERATGIPTQKGPGQHILDYLGE